MLTVKCCSETELKIIGMAFATDDRIFYRTAYCSVLKEYDQIKIRISYFS